MQATSLLPCLWPGLPRLWRRGDWRALLTAIGFAALLNSGVVCTFAWPNWLPGWVTGIGWTAIGLIWVSSAWHASRSLSRLNSVEDAPGDELLTQAQREYLTGDWFETESLLQQILRMNDDDADARLMLATLYRRTGRATEAEECLGRLDRMESAGRWVREIARERSLLATEESQRNTD